MKNQASVIFDAPGPKARVRHNILTVLAVLVGLAIAYWIYARFDALDQWDSKLWTAFLRPEVWTAQILPGLLNTLQAAAVAAVLAVLFGVVFGVARLSDHAWIRIPAGVVVEFFRAIPLVLMIFFIFFMQWGGVVARAAVVAAGLGEHGTTPPIGRQPGWQSRATRVGGSREPEGHGAMRRSGVTLTSNGVPVWKTSSPVTNPACA